MDADRWRRIKAILDELIELDPDSRPALLEEKCGGDSALRAEVEKYLAAHQQEGVLDVTRTSVTTTGTQVLALPEIPGYRIVRRIGDGGQGAVFEATEEKLDRQVALKVLAMGRDPQARERFLREARIAGTLNHPNLVPVFDFGHAGDTLYFTMPLVYGLSMEDLIPCLHNRAESEMPDWLTLPEDRADRLRKILRWFEGAMEGLGHAHRKGIVHRDIKPSNLLLDRESGLLRVTDFGIARAGHLPEMTRTGSVMGTVIFMSPEQVRGENQKIDVRSDVYSMGVSLYRTLLDRPPFSAETTGEYLNKILNAAPYQPRGKGATIPRDLLTILLKSMEKTRRHRYPDIQSMEADLAAFRRYEPIQARTVGAGGRALRWARRRPAVAALLVLLMLSLGIASGIGVRAARSAAVLRAQETERWNRDATYDMAEDHFEDAYVDFSRVLARNSQHLDARLRRVLVVIQTLADGAEQASSDVGRERIETALADLDIVQKSHPEVSSIDEMRRRLYEELGREAEAAEAAARSSEAVPQEAIEFQILGDLAWVDDDQSAAIEHYSRALRLDPQLPLARLRRGVAHKNKGQGQKARIDYEVLAGVWPDHYRPHNNLGNLLSAMGENEDSFAAFERAIKTMTETEPLVHFNFGSALYRAKRYEPAEQQLRLAIDLDPDDTTFRNQLGRLLKKTGKIDEAIEQYVTVLKLEDARPEGPNLARIGKAHVNLCDIYLERRDVERGGPSCLKDLELRPDNATSHYNMAMLKMLSGDPAGALESLEKNVALGDHDFGYLLDDDVFDPLHDDSRFQRLIERMREDAAQDT